MSKPSDNPADPFKKALAEATKTLADDPEMDVSFSVDPPGMNEDGMRLPQVTRRMTRDEVLLARGTADSYAMRRKYHDDACFNRYAPQGQMARDIYQAMEMARCEAMGARDMPGTAGNIDARIEHQAMRKGYDEVKEAAEAPLSVAVGYLSWNGHMDTAIAIRTAVIKDKHLSIQAGAGIVADSVPEAEYQEVLAKSAILRRALAMAEEGL